MSPLAAAARSTARPPRVDATFAGECPVRGTRIGRRERHRQRTRCLRAFQALLVTGLLAADAGAQEPPPVITFSVDAVSDLPDDNAGNGVCHTSAGTCSLRAAVMEANRSSVVAAQIRILLPAGTYRLTRAPAGFNGDDNGDLNLTAPSAGQSITLIGASAANTIIDANRIDRALRIEGGRVVTIAGVTIRNGFVTGESGGGIRMSSSTVSIEDSVVEENQTANNGGGIHNGFSTLNIARSTIRSNRAGDTGGGLFVFGRTTIRDSTLSGNDAQEGGGIQNSDQVTLINSTLSGNHAYGDGGGIYNSSETFLYNTTIADNDANHQSVMFGSGGGVFTQEGTRFVVFNSVIVGNTTHGSYAWDCSGSLEAYGRNFLGVVDATRNCTVPNPFGWSVMGRSALGPLRDNGGATPTHALLPGSPAIDATTIQGCVGPSDIALTTDQRGLPRGAGADCDSGAFEFAAGTIFGSGFE